MPIDIGTGLAALGVGIAIGVGALGTGAAMGSVGAASVAAITEKPELFGRAIVFVGITESPVIFSFVIAVLLMVFTIMV
ncbi:MAG: hypothetical protein HY929_02585 [Euryarchaeota archaeon]|nr:hypothetical protein [Euryarchaeota archaeon]